MTKLSDDPRDLEPLTPNHLLLLRSGSQLSPGIFNKDDCGSTKRWRQVQYLANVRVLEAMDQGIPTIITRTVEMDKDAKKFGGWRYRLILDEKTPRCSWPLGRILEVHTNRKDGLVRSAKVKTSSSVLVRPVDKSSSWNLTLLH